MPTLVRLVSPESSCEMEVDDGDGSIGQWLAGARHPATGLLRRDGQAITGQVRHGDRASLEALCTELVCQARVAVLTGYRRTDHDLDGTMGDDYPPGGRLSLWAAMPETLIMDVRPRRPGSAEAVAFWAMRHDRCLVRLRGPREQDCDVFLLSHFDAPRRVILGHVTPHASGIDDPSADIHIGMGDMDRILEMAGAERNGTRGKRSS